MHWGTFASRTVSFVSEGLSYAHVSLHAAMCGAYQVSRTSSSSRATSLMADHLELSTQQCKRASPCTRQSEAIRSPVCNHIPASAGALLELSAAVLLPRQSRRRLSPWTRADLLRTFKLPGCAARPGDLRSMGARPRADERAVRLWIFDSGPNRKGIKYEPVATAVNSYLELEAVGYALAAELVFTFRCRMLRRGS